MSLGHLDNGNRNLLKHTVTTFNRLADPLSVRVVDRTHDNVSLATLALCDIPGSVLLCMHFRGEKRLGALHWSQVPPTIANKECELTVRHYQQGNMLLGRPL